MHKTNNPEFRTQGLYGTSMFDHGLDFLANHIGNPSRKIIDRLYRAGMLATATGGITNTLDHPIIPSLQIKSDALKVSVTLPGYEQRFFSELGVVLAGVTILGVAMALEERRNWQRNQALKEQIAASLSPEPETS